MTGTYDLTLFGYFARLRPPAPYPQSQNTVNHAVFEGWASLVDTEAEQYSTATEQSNGGGSA